MSIMNFYVYIVNIIYKLTAFVNPKLRSFFFKLSCFGLSIWYFLYSIPYTKDLLLSTYILGHNFHKRLTFVALLVLLLFSSIDRKVANTKWNKKLLFLYFLFPIGVLINSFFIEISEELRYFALESVTILPCLYVTWKNKNIAVIYTTFAYTNIIVTVLYYINCIFASKYGLLNNVTGYFSATISNSNILGSLMLVSIISSIYILLSDNDPLHTIISCLSLSVSIVFLILSGSRVSILSATAIIILLFVYVLKTKAKNVFSFRKFITFLLSLLIVITITTLMLETNSKNTKVLDNQFTISQYIENVDDKFSTNGKTLNQISSSRINIWTSYIEKINLRGHDYYDYAYANSNPMRSHNSFIEVLYFTSFPIGLVFIIFNIYTYLIVIRMFLKNNVFKTNYLFIFLITICYFAFSMLEVSLELDAKLITLFFYILVIPEIL